MTRARSSLIALAVLIWAGAAWGADTLSERAAAIERASTEPDGARVVVGHISRKLAVPVEKLRAERQQTGLGWGDLLIGHLIAHRLAKTAGLTLEQLAGELRGGKTWDEIALAHKVDPAPLIVEVEHSQEATARRAEDKPPTAHSLTGAERPPPKGRQRY